MLEHAAGAIRTLLILAICTGQRPGDVERMKWSQVIGDFVRVRQQKTKELVEIPIHPMLRAELERLRSEGPVAGVIVRKGNGRPIGDGGFRYRMKTLINNIPNMPWRTPHGSRYAAAALLRDAGCDIDQICSIVGHRTYIMALKYFKRRKLAMEAMAAMVRYAAIPQLAMMPPSGSLIAISTDRPITSCDNARSRVTCRFAGPLSTGVGQLDRCSV